MPVLFMLARSGDACAMDRHEITGRAHSVSTHLCLRRLDNHLELILDA